VCPVCALCPVEFRRALRNGPFWGREFSRWLQHSEIWGVVMGQLGVVLETRREFWRAIARGLSTQDAAVGAGVSKSAGKRWFKEAGGMCPISLAAPSSRFLSFAEREEIAVGIAAKRGDKEIGRELGRHRSTVYRERCRNAPGRYPARYRAGVAQRQAELRARRPKPTKLELVDRLRETVQVMLNEKYSPEQISGRLIVDHPDDLEMRMSPETIYRSIYVQAAGELRKDLKTCLRTGRAVRKPRRRVGARKPSIPDKVMIADRPEILDPVDGLAFLGIWQGDLIIGKDGKSAIGTLVDTRTGYLMLLYLADNHRAETVRDAIIDAVRRMPTTMRRSLTWDQGVELAEHAQITFATDLQVYFCNPHSPWERPLNENTNGLVRQYYPKGTDLSVHSPADLETVETQLNSRPRKRHGFYSPAEVLAQLLSELDKQAGVATTD
jgi:transposase, IS30 family